MFEDVSRVDDSCKQQAPREMQHFDNQGRDRIQLIYSIRRTCSVAAYCILIHVWRFDCSADGDESIGKLPNSYIFWIVWIVYSESLFCQFKFEVAIN